MNEQTNIGEAERENALLRMQIAVVLATSHTCEHCGQRRPVERLRFSTFTHSYYCTDWRACDRSLERENALLRFEARMIAAQPTPPISGGAA